MAAIIWRIDGPKMNYDVTIGIPVYKSKAFIRRTLESALAQSYPSIEFLAFFGQLYADFFIFVDGWDFACFDAVQGQTFELDLGFALAADAANADYTIVS